MKAPAEGFVDVPKLRLVVAGDHQLEGGHELEEVLPHVPGRDGVAAGERLDAGLGPATALFGLHGGHQAGTT